MLTPRKLVHWNSAFWALAALLLLGLPTRNYNGDGLAIIDRLPQVAWWESFDPNKLLWGPLVDLTLWISHRLGLPTHLPAEAAWLQFLNGLIGLAVLWEISQWAKELGLGIAARLISLGFVLVSFTFWHFTTDIDMYILLLLASLKAVRSLWSYLDTGASRGWWGAIGWSAFGLLVHQLAILVVILQLGLLCRFAPPGEPAAGWSRCLRFLGWGILLVGLSYVLVAEVLYRDTIFGGLWNFIGGPTAAGGASDWAPLKYARNPLLWVWAVLIGHWNLIGFADHPEVFYSFHAIGHPPLFQLGWTTLLPIGWLLLCALGWRQFSALTRREPDPTRFVRIFTLRWFLPVLFIFCIFLQPGYAYYRLLYLPALALILGVLIEARRVSVPLAATGVIALGLWNLGLGIGPNSVWGQPPLHAQVRLWAPDIEARDLVITVRKPYPTLVQYLRVFNGASRIVTDGNSWIVFPPPGVSRDAFADGESADFAQWYRTIWLDTALADEFRQHGRLACRYRTMPSYVEREVVFLEEEWELGEVLVGDILNFHWVALVPRQNPP